jgi:hypothetical protein
MNTIRPVAPDFPPAYQLGMDTATACLPILIASGRSLPPQDCELFWNAVLSSLSGMMQAHIGHPAALAVIDDVRKATEHPAVPEGSLQ